MERIGGAGWKVFSPATAAVKIGETMLYIRNSP